MTAVTLTVAKWKLSLWQFRFTYIFWKWYCANSRITKSIFSYFSFRAQNQPFIFSVCIHSESNLTPHLNSDENLVIKLYYMFSKLFSVLIVISDVMTRCFLVFQCNTCQKVLSTVRNIQIFQEKRKILKQFFFEIRQIVIYFQMDFFSCSGKRWFIGWWKHNRDNRDVLFILKDWNTSLR